MRTTYEVQPRKNEDGSKIIMVKKIAMMQQHSTEQRSTVDSRRRLTNFKMLVSQSLNVSSLETVCLTIVKCYIKSSKCRQEHVNSLLRMLSKSLTFLDFRLSQGSVSVATCCRWDGNLCDVYIENFLTNQSVKEFWKIGPHLRQLLSNIKRHTFLRHRVSVYNNWHGALQCWHGALQCIRFAFVSVSSTCCAKSLHKFLAPYVHCHRSSSTIICYRWNIGQSHRFVMVSKVDLYSV